MDGNRASYTAAAERLGTFTGGGRPVPLAGIGDELLAVSALLAGQPGLRRTLADPARAGEERAALLDSLLAGKVAEDTRDVLRLLVAGRWSTPTELLTATERLGVEALLAGAEADGDLAEVSDELFRFQQIVDGNLDLASALGTSTVPADRRQELAHGLLEGKARPVTVRLVDLALHGFGGRTFSGALTRLVELAAERQDRQLAYVTVAAGLTEAEERTLQDKLARIYGRTVDLKVSVDPTILGGARVRVGSDLYDATVLRRLTEARTALAGR